MYRYLAPIKKIRSSKKAFSRINQFVRFCRDFMYEKGRNKVRDFFLIGVAGYIGFFPLITIVSVLTYAVFTQLGISLPIQPIVEFSLRNNSNIVAIFLFISVVFAAPLLEEFIMRGLIFRAFLKRFSPLVAIIFSGFIFGAFHFNLFSFFQISVFGMFLSWLYLSTGSLLPGIIAHSLFNGINFVGLRFLR
jgi:membrane protease YdiL (CAAX protease family)